MNAIPHFGLFLIASTLVHLTPGPDTFYVLGRTLAQGRRAGLASSLGIGAGAVILTLAAALGLSALLAASPAAFLVVKYAGVLYLVYLGLRLFLSQPTTPTGTLPPPADRGLLLFRQGLLTNLLNPKVALFFVAFLPQFVDPAAPSKFTAFLILGLCFATTTTLWFFIMVTFAALLKRQLDHSPRLTRLLPRGVGLLLILLGLKLALTPGK